MATADERERCVPTTLLTTSSWRQVRAMDNAVTGEWYHHDDGVHGLYISSVNDEWEVGLYLIESNHGIETRRFESLSLASEYFRQLAWDNRS